MNEIFLEFNYPCKTFKVGDYGRSLSLINLCNPVPESGIELTWSMADRRP